MNGTAQLQFLRAGEIDLHLDASGHLEGVIGGERASGVQARALFPFSRPGEYIELRGDSGDLIGFVHTLAELRPEVADAIRESVRLGHFVPYVQRILSVKGTQHLYTWNVITDRGRAEFHIRGRRQNLEEIGGDEHMVTDTEGVRYRIPKVPDLDPKSVSQLRKVL